MNGRPMAKNMNGIAPLLDLIERRFSVRIEPGPREHLTAVYEHYREKRAMLLLVHGEAGSLVSEDYAKAVLISETARLLILREIKPVKRKKKKT